MTYKRGMFFGEMSLLRSKPRHSSVYCDEETLLAYIDKNTFMRLLGPLKEVLEANMNKYKAFAKNF